MCGDAILGKGNKGSRRERGEKESPGNNVSLSWPSLWKLVACCFGAIKEATHNYIIKLSFVENGEGGNYLLIRSRSPLISVYPMQS